MAVQPSALADLHDEVARCNKCGFCLAACPLYRVTGRERSVARGHNAHVRRVIEGSLPLTRDVGQALMECLLCKQCVAGCFPGVKTDELVVAARTAYLEERGEPAALRFVFRHLLTDQDRLGRYMAVLRSSAWVSRRLGLWQALPRIAGQDPKEEAFLPHDTPASFPERRPGLLAAFAGAASMVGLPPRRFFREMAAQLGLAGGTAGGAAPTRDSRAKSVAYFAGCGINFLLPNVGVATVRILKAMGYEVHLAHHACCGLPAYTYGDQIAARLAARRNIEAFAAIPAGAIVTECGSCSSFLKHYPLLFEGEDCLTQEARAFSDRVKDMNEFMIDLVGYRGPERQGKAAVTYHDPCHLSRHLKITEEPREILKQLPGLRYTELPEADWCCGGAGTFNLHHYRESMGVLERKMDNVSATGASTLATSCPACIIQLAHGARYKKPGLRVAHVVELVSETLLPRETSEGA